MAEQERKLEESFEQISSIIAELEKPGVSLEDSFRLYQEGIQLLKNCNDSIDQVEKKLMILNENGEIHAV